jgi:hypothetical protein
MNKINQVLSDIQEIEKEVLSELAEYRDQKRLKVAQKLTGYPVQNLSNYLNGVIKISHEKLFKIAKGLFRGEN